MTPACDPRLWRPLPEAGCRHIGCCGGAGAALTQIKAGRHAMFSSTTNCHPVFVCGAASYDQLVMEAVRSSA
jgi:hypothetical protein